jgi:tetratricopeptide (TPR) repeat protein
MTPPLSADKLEDADQWCQKGQALADAGRHREALAAFTKALSRNPELAQAYFYRSASYYHIGRYVQAGQDLDAAAILGCRDAQFWSRFESGADDEPAPDGEGPA